MTVKAPKPGPPEGYTDVTIHGPTAAKVKASTGATWRKPLHGTYVLVDDAGNVLGHIRTLGIFLPVKDRRYSLRIHGVLFHRIVPMLSPTRLIPSEAAPYDTPLAARKAGSALIARMRKEAP